MTERFLRHQGIGQPQLAERQREILKSLLQFFEIQDLDKQFLLTGVSDSNYQDLEDSYQFQCATKAKCSVILTINKKDFHTADTSLQVLTPQEFIGIYINPTL